MNSFRLTLGFDRLVWGFGALATCLVLSAGAAQAANCGGKNQRACKLWERVPSCNAGLSEINKPGYCTAPRPVKVLPGKPKCGANGQRPCTVVERIPSCNSGLVEDFVRNQCVKKATGYKEIAQACYRNFENVALAMAPVARCVANLKNPGNLATHFERKDVNTITDVLLYGTCRREVTQAAQVMRRNGFASMSVGIGGEVGAGAGLLSEFFVAIDTDLKSRPYLYETLGYKFGKFKGGSVNGIVTANRGAASSLAGDGQAVSLSFKALGGAGFSAGLSFAKGNETPNCVSTSVAAGAGAEVNAGSLNRFITLKLY